MKKAELLMKAGPTPGRIIKLQDSELALGREDSNSIVIADVEVSRKHCRIYYEGGVFMIEDLGSTNGTAINGARISHPHLLKQGDILKLGDNVTLEFQMPEAGSGYATADAHATPPRGTPRPTFEQEPMKAQPLAPNMERGVSRKQSSGAAPSSESPRSRKRPSVFMIGCAIVVLIAMCAFVGIWWYIDTYAPEYYCYLLPFLAGCP